MKKRIFTLFIAAFMFLGLIPGASFLEVAEATEATEYYFEAEDYLTYTLYDNGTGEASTKTFSPNDAAIKKGDYHGGKRFEYNFSTSSKVEVEIPFTVEETANYKVVLSSLCRNNYTNSGSSLYFGDEVFFGIASSSTAGAVEEWTKTVKGGLTLTQGESYTFKIAFTKATGQPGYCRAYWDYLLLQKTEDTSRPLDETETVRLEAEDYLMTKQGYKGNFLSHADVSFKENAEASGGIYLDSDYETGERTGLSFKVRAPKTAYYIIKTRFYNHSNISYNIAKNGVKMATLSQDVADDVWAISENEIYLAEGEHTIEIYSLPINNSGLSRLTVDYIDITADLSKNPSPNLAPYGTFDTEYDVKRYTHDEGSKSEWRQDATYGGCFASAATSQAWNSTSFAEIPNVAGEEYDIYFDIRTESGTDTFQFMSDYVEAGGRNYTFTYMTNREIGTDWRKMHIVISDISAVRTDGCDVSTDLIRMGVIRESGVNKWFYIDNLEIYARGNVSYDWTPYLNGLSKTMEPFDSDDGFAEEQAETGDAYKAFYVDAASGSDSNNGTEAAPFKTINKAREAVKPYLATMTGHIYVYIKGEHNLESKITWSTEDSGCNGYNVIYTSWGDAQPEITMKEEFSGFTLHDEEKNIWKVYVGLDNPARQVFINDVRGVRARTSDRLKSGDLLTEWIRTDSWEERDDYYVSNDTYLADLTNQEYVELVNIAQWTNGRIMVDKIYKIDDKRVRIDFDKESWDQYRYSYYTHTGISSPTWIENAYELLDSKGEWYINRKDGYLYYMPRDYETPETMVATIPVGSQAFVVAGDSTDSKVHNIVFDNLAFKYLTWAPPGVDDFGIREELGLYIRRDGDNPYPGDGRTTGETAEAAITILDAAYVDVRNCTLAHLGGGAIFYQEVFQNCEITGNHIYDVSATGIMLGHAKRMIRDEYKYISPTQYKNYIINNKINNNLIHDLGVDYRGAPAILATLLINSEIMHNEIYNTDYTALYIGWGLDSYIDRVYSNIGNKVMYNYVHDIMPYLNDGGGVYFMGAAGGENEFAYNYFENLINSSAAIYCDTGTDYWQIHDNVIDARETGTKWYLNAPAYSENLGSMYNNYSTTSVGSDFNITVPDGVREEALVYETANWPTAAKEIVNNAGLEAEYLEKYSENTQRLRLSNEKADDYYLSSGETMQMSVTKIGRKLSEKGTGDILYYSTDTSVATVSASGLITAVDTGRCSIYAEFLDGEVVRRKNVNLIVGDEAETIDVDIPSVISLLVDDTLDITATAKTIFGNTVSVVPTVTFGTSGIVTASNGVLTGKSVGKTTMHVTYKADDVTVQKDVTVYVTKYNNGISTLIKYAWSNNEAPSDAFYKKDNWTGKATETTDGISVSGIEQHFMPAYYKTPITNSKVLKLKMSINNPGSWPSIVLKAKDLNQNYENTDGYVITFREGGVELRRFINGECTTIFGDKGLGVIGGPAFANSSLYGYGETFEVKVGAIDESSGVRIVLLIGSNAVFDYLDTEGTALKGDGYFGVYEWAGNITLQK